MIFMLIGNVVLLYHCLTCFCFALHSTHTWSALPVLHGGHIILQTSMADAGTISHASISENVHSTLILVLSQTE